MRVWQGGGGRRSVEKFEKSANYLSLMIHVVELPRGRRRDFAEVEGHQPENAKEVLLYIEPKVRLLSVPWCRSL